MIWALLAPPWSLIPVDGLSLQLCGPATLREYLCLLFPLIADPFLCHSFSRDALTLLPSLIAMLCLLGSTYWNFFFFISPINPCTHYALELIYCDLKNVWVLYVLICLYHITSFTSLAWALVYIYIGCIHIYIL